MMCFNISTQAIFSAPCNIIFIVLFCKKKKKVWRLHTVDVHVAVDVNVVIHLNWKKSCFFKKFFCGTKFGVNILSHLLSLFHIISLPSILNASQGKNGEYSPRPRYRHQGQINKISNGILWSFKLMYQFWKECW